MEGYEKGSSYLELRDSTPQVENSSMPQSSPQNQYVTVSEYCAFLNAVAACDSHYLYNEKMGSDPLAACIMRSGTSGHYRYSIISGQENFLIKYVNFADEARYCNWLQNGKTTGDQGPETTEDGAYTLDIADNESEQKGVAIIANAEARYFLPSEWDANASSLKSNKSIFIVENAGAPLLTMLGNGVIVASEAATDGIVEDIVITLAIIVVAGGHGGEIETSEERDPSMLYTTSEMLEQGRMQGEETLSRLIEHPVTSVIMSSGDGGNLKLSEDLIREHSMTSFAKYSSGLQSDRRAVFNHVGTELDDADQMTESVSRGGLTNNAADCFINSSLQLIKAFKQLISYRVISDMTYFSKFLHDDLNTDEDCKELRREMTREVIGNSQDFNPVGIDGIPQPVVIDGTAQTHEDAAAFLRLLLVRTRMPQVIIEKKISNVSTGRSITSGEEPTQLLDLTLPEEEGNITMQRVVDDFFNPEPADFSIKEDDILWSENYSITQQFKIRGELPPSLTVRLKRFNNHGIKTSDHIEGFDKSITLFAEDGQSVIYEPKAIICHIGDSLEHGHYVCYRNIDDRWLLFDDDKDVGNWKIQKTPDHDPSKDCYIISYHQVDSKISNDGIWAKNQNKRSALSQSIIHQAFTLFGDSFFLERTIPINRQIADYIKRAQSTRDIARKNYYTEVANMATKVAQYRNIFEKVSGAKFFHNIEQSKMPLVVDWIFMVNKAEEALQAKIDVATVVEASKINFFERKAAQANQIAEYMYNSIQAALNENKKDALYWSEKAMFLAENQHVDRIKSFSYQQGNASQDGSKNIAYYWKKIKKTAAKGLAVTMKVLGSGYSNAPFMPSFRPSKSL